MLQEINPFGISFESYDREGSRGTSAVAITKIYDTWIRHLGT